MIVGILLLHSFLGHDKINLGELPPHSVAVLIEDFFSNLISRSCVPLFFAISGFLLFNNVSNLDFHTYLSKLKSRCRSLLVPYLLWNLLGVIILLIEKQPFMNSFFPGLAQMEFGIKDFFMSFWAYKGNYSYDFFDNGGLPIDPPLWFLRNLIILVILSPVIYFLFKRLGGWLMAFLGGCYLFGFWFQLDGFAPTGVVFFCLGAWLGISRNYRLIEKVVDSRWIFPAYGVLAVATMIVMQTSPETMAYQILYALTTALGVGAWFKVASICVDRGKRLPAVLVGSTFFLYAFHGLFSNLIKKVVEAALHPATDLSWTITYFLVFLIIFCLSYGSYRVSRCLLPRFTLILCGGR